jgi:methionyl-tRNA synthetase
VCGASASPAAHARASRYQAQLVEHITANPSFIQPEARRNDILQRLQREPLLDLSISRTTFDWGIPLPDDPKHVMCAAARCVELD